MPSACGRRHRDGRETTVLRARAEAERLVRDGFELYSLRRVAQFHGFIDFVLGRPQRGPLASGWGSEPAVAHTFVRGIADDPVTRHRLAARTAFNRVYQAELDGLWTHVHRLSQLIDTELAR